MKVHFIIVLFLMCCHLLVEAQKGHRARNMLRPGLSFSYLPTWLLDPYDGNMYASTIIIGVNGHQEIWKESVFIFGIAYDKMYGNNLKEDEGLAIPMKLQKYFSQDRTGFNLSGGILLHYCTTCRYKIGGGNSYEISHLYTFQHMQVNAAIQIMTSACPREDARN